MALSERDKEQIDKLSFGLGGEPGISVEDFLRSFRHGSTDRNLLVGELLSEAVEAQERDDVELALVVGHSLGFKETHINSLATLALADWHHCHERLAEALDDIRTPACVNALYELTQWVPRYLDFDDARALGSKAVWALSKIGDISAKCALEKVSDNQKDHIGLLAQAKLAELG